MTGLPCVTVTISSKQQNIFAVVHCTIYPRSSREELFKIGCDYFLNEQSTGVLRTFMST